MEKQEKKLLLRVLKYLLLSMCLLMAFIYADQWTYLLSSTVRSALPQNRLETIDWSHYH